MDLLEDIKGNLGSALRSKHGFSPLRPLLKPNLLDHINKNGMGKPAALVNAGARKRDEEEPPVLQEVMAAQQHLATHLEVRDKVQDKAKDDGIK